jgi:serine/threonine protein kinase/tetratricopeptide (TPR) repeat protein
MPYAWHQVRDILANALDMRPEERAGFVRQACGSDQVLLAEVESLLLHHDQADSLLEHSPTSGWLSFDPAAWTGRRIGAYKIVRELGEGGMAVVYLGERDDEQFRKRVAIKMLRPGFYTAEIVHRFRNERQTLAVLDHPNIVKLLDGGSTEDGLPYLVMDYVEGVAIDQYCGLHQLSAPARLQLFLNVCAAVRCAHQNRVIHRDLKPGNILITKDGVPRLLDFGIAKLLNPELLQTPLVTEAEWRPMTLEYASPEQVRGEPVTEASDIYSLGILLYELLAGRRPYNTVGKSRLEAERMICEQEPERPSALLGVARRALEGDLDIIIMKALRKEPEQRYASVAEFAEDIQNHLSGLPVRARNPTVTYRTGRFLRRHRESFAIAMAGLMLVGVIGAWEAFAHHRKTLDVREASPSSLAQPTPPAGAPQMRSMAVLPFQTMPEPSYLGLGLADALINRMGALSQITVRPVSAVRKYSEGAPDPLAAGRELGVDVVLDGNVQQAGDRVRVTVQLLRVTDGAALWSGKFDERTGDLFALEDSITRQVIDGLPLNLTESERSRLTKHYTEDSQAWQAYLRGRYFWNRRTPEGHQKAIEEFEQATRIDPRYALAYAGLADAYVLLGSNPNRLLSRGQAMTRARAAALHAIELDGDLAEAHTSLAFIRMHYDWKWADAETEFQRAIALNPSYATAYQWHAINLLVTGHPEDAVKELKKAQALDPLSLIIGADLAEIYDYVGQLGEAKTEARRVLDLDPTFAPARCWLAYALAGEGRYDEAAAVLDRGPTDASYIITTRGYVYAIAGRRAEAQHALERLIRLARNDYAIAFNVATVYASMGDVDGMLPWLERAFAERSGSLLLLNVTPQFAAVRSDPRFLAFEGRVGLPEFRSRIR